MINTQEIKQNIASWLKEFLLQEFDLEKVEIDWERPPESEMGDLAFSCFKLTKEVGKNPLQIAEIIATKFSGNEYVSLIKNVGPYVNFYLNKEIFSQTLIDDILTKKDNFGRGDKKQQKVMLEGFGQPNTHKAFHIGHLRNVFISESMSNLLKFSGYEVIRANYYGDVGTHIATWLWYFINYVEDKDEILDAEVGPELSRRISEIYTQAKNKIDEVDNAEEQISEILQKVEAGDKELIKLWKQTKQLSLKDFERIYKLLEIEFDKKFFESEVEKPGKKIVQQYLDKGLIKKSDGALIIDLEKYDLGVLLMLKSDRTSLYSTKDIALAKLKFEKFKIDKSIYVIDMRQSLYMKQIFKALELMGFEQAENCHHLAYGFVKLKSGVMASRKGNVILAQDLYDQIIAKVKTEIAKRENIENSEVNKIAHKITLSALKFGMLKYTPTSNITFDLEQSLQFEGDTGPYLQYSYARINSIKEKSFAKTKLKISKLDFSAVKTKEEWELVIQLEEFGDVITKATDDYNPTALASYLLNLAATFNKFYAKCPVARVDDENLRLVRFALCESVAVVLKSGLNILGIEVVERM